jgi:hypothetical protein
MNQHFIFTIRAGQKELGPHKLSIADLLLKISIICTLSHAFLKSLLNCQREVYVISYLCNVHTFKFLVVFGFWYSFDSHWLQYCRRQETEELMKEYVGIGPWIFLFMFYFSMATWFQLTRQGYDVEQMSLHCALCATI